MMQTHPGVAPSGEARIEPARFERLLSGIASSFIEAPLDRYEAVLGEALREIVLAFDLDRSAVVEADSASELRVVQSWSRHGIAAPLPSGPTAITFQWAGALLRRGLPVVLSRMSDAPPEAASDVANMAKLGLRSHVSMPVYVAGEFISVLTFGVVRAEREWTEATLARMRLLADIFGSFHARKIARDRIDEQRRFEALLVDLSTSLASVHGERAEAEVKRAVQSAGSFLRASRLQVYRAVAGRLELVRAWHAPDAAPPGASTREEERRALKEVLAGRLARASDGTLGGTTGMLAMPLFSGGTVAGALVLARAGKPGPWPEELLPRLEVFGNMLAGAMARRAAEDEARRAMLEAAEHRERLAHLARVDAVGAMSAAIAHEINQPLAAIRNYALAAQRRLASEERVDRERLSALADKIAGQAGAASEVLDRVRALVRRREPRESPIDMAALCANALALIELEARRHEVRVQRRIARQLPAALGDDIQIQQVLINLANNGIEAMAGMPAGARVLRLSVAHGGGDRLLVAVTDTGPGVAAADVERIFEPFFSTSGAGLGIGLSICRTIVEAHGGELWYEPGPGGGSSFRFTLPVAGEGA